MVTIYGDDKIGPEDLLALLRKRKISYPVLLDPTRAWRDALELAVYPTATLIDREGRVVWQGGTGRVGFGAACEKRLEALLAADPESGTGPGPAPR